MYKNCADLAIAVKEFYGADPFECDPKMIGWAANDLYGHFSGPKATNLIKKQVAALNKLRITKGSVPFIAK